MPRPRVVSVVQTFGDRADFRLHGRPLAISVLSRLVFCMVISALRIQINRSR
jgi:hypothetical protein